MKLFGAIGKLLRMCWSLLAGVSRVITVAVPIIMLVALVYIVTMALQQARPVAIEPGTVLMLQPVGSVVEDRTPIGPLQALLQQDIGGEVLLADMVEAIDQASNDARVSAMVIDLDQAIGPGISQSLELISALDRFKAAGKPVIAIGDFYTQGHYFLAAQADEVLLHPKGSLELRGFGVYNYYLQRLLQKVKVTMHVFRAGENKSAVEPFIRNDMSVTERKVVGRWLGSLWQDYTAVVERGRGLETGTIDRVIADSAQLLRQHNGDMAELMLGLGLVDGLANDAAMEARIAELAGNNDAIRKDSSVGFEAYLEALAFENLQLSNSPGPVIAIVPIEGDLVPGESIDGFAGSDTVLERLRRTAQIPGLRAVILRVNTPGGSVFAADVMRDGVMELKAMGLPVVVSMASMAASGGYYIAAETDHIVAQPTTITGSIGVFAVVPTLERLYEYAGVSVDGVGTTVLADSFRSDMPLSDASKSILQQTVASIYRDFLMMVARGRGMTLEQVAAIAEGKVWSGRDALEVGLVDSLGGLAEAIQIAADLADIQRWQVERVATPISFEQLFLQQLGVNIGANRVFTASPIAEMARQLGPPLRLMDSFRDPRNMYVRCMPCVDGL